MDEIIPAGETNDDLSIERCRELLGDDAIELCDDEVDRIRQCADTTPPNHSLDRATWLLLALNAGFGAGRDNRGDSYRDIASLRDLNVNGG